MIDKANCGLEHVIEFENEIMNCEELSNTFYYSKQYHEKFVIISSIDTSRNSRTIGIVLLVVRKQILSLFSDTLHNVNTE